MPRISHAKCKSSRALYVLYALKKIKRPKEKKISGERRRKNIFSGVHIYIYSIFFFINHIGRQRKPRRNITKKKKRVLL